MILVAFLPLVAVELPHELGYSVPMWAFAVDMLCVSVPLAVLLGVSALRVPVWIVRG